MKHKLVLLIGRNTRDSIKDGLIITATVTAIIFALKAADVKPPNLILGAMIIIKLADRMCGWVTSGRLFSLQETD